MMVGAGIAGAAIDEDRRDANNYAATDSAQPQEGLAHAAQYHLGGAARQVG